MVMNFHCKSSCLLGQELQIIKLDNATKSYAMILVKLITICVHKSSGIIKVIRDSCFGYVENSTTHIYTTVPRSNIIKDN